VSNSPTDGAGAAIVAAGSKVAVLSRERHGFLSVPGDQPINVGYSSSNFGSRYSTSTLSSTLVPIVSCRVLGLGRERLVASLMTAALARFCEGAWGNQTGGAQH
jgi:hypothetical protein